MYVSVYVGPTTTTILRRDPPNLMGFIWGRIFHHGTLGFRNLFLWLIIALATLCGYIYTPTVSGGSSSNLVALHLGLGWPAEHPRFF